MQVPPTVSWPPKFVRQVRCVQGWGMTVDATGGYVVVTGCWNTVDNGTLHVYSLDDGTRLQSLGGTGSGQGCFNWRRGGACTTHRGTLLVAECHNNRLQEVDVRVDGGAWVRFVGVGVLDKPDFVDCSESVIAVSESSNDRVALLSWADGLPLGRFGGGEADGLTGAGGRLKMPCGLRLLASGGGVVVADYDNDRVCVFSMAGALLSSLLVGSSPFDVVECDGGGSYIVTNDDNTLSKVSAVTGEVVPFGRGGGSGNGQFNCPSAVAVVPSSSLCGRPGSGSGAAVGVSLLVLDVNNGRIQVFQG